MKLVLSLFAAASLLCADFDPQHWQIRTPIAVEQPAPVSAIVIDPAVCRASRARLRDLRIVRAGAEVPYRVEILSAGRKTSALTVDYPVSTRRYMRVTIPGWRDPAYLMSVGLTEAAAVRDIVSTPTPSATEDPKAQTTSLVADIGFQGLAYDRLNLTVEQGAFSRSVEISTSSDAKEWSFSGQGVISQDQLSIDFPEQWNRYVKITVFNRDNAPLKIIRVSLSALRRLLRFPSMATGPYWLYSGNPDAKQPSYDFASLAPASPVSLGAPEHNPQYRAPIRPWSDRNPNLLNFVLIAAVAVMGFITIRVLRKVVG